MNTLWNITYTNREGVSSTTDFLWYDEKPTDEQAAIGIREKLLGRNYLLVDMNRDETKPTVHLLKAYGYRIVGIERASDSD